MPKSWGRWGCPEASKARSPETGAPTRRPARWGGDGPRRRPRPRGPGGSGRRKRRSSAARWATAAAAAGRRGDRRMAGHARGIGRGTGGGHRLTAAAPPRRGGGRAAMTTARRRSSARAFDRPDALQLYGANRYLSLRGKPSRHLRQPPRQAARLQPATTTNFRARPRRPPNFRARATTSSIS